jgi:hypothetical protein
VAGGGEGDWARAEGDWARWRAGGATVGGGWLAVRGWRAGGGGATVGSGWLAGGGDARASGRGARCSGGVVLLLGCLGLGP